MKRGEVWWVSLDPTIGGEIKKTRPAVIVSNNISNDNLNRVQVVPITSQMHKLYPCEAAINLKGNPGKAMADQLRTVSKQRLSGFIAQLSDKEMHDVDDAIKLQLGLDWLSLFFQRLIF